MTLTICDSDCDCPFRRIINAARDAPTPRGVTLLVNAARAADHEISPYNCAAWLLPVLPREALAITSTSVLLLASIQRRRSKLMCK